MMFWTMNTEEAMGKSDGGLQRLQAYYDRLQAQLLETVGVVRSDVNKLQRATLEALIVLDVHAKDVLKSELIVPQISDA
jgi:dynein heavy chain